LDVSIRLLPLNFKGRYVVVLSLPVTVILPTSLSSAASWCDWGVLGAVPSGVV